jgi:NADH-quinone oxidoreductase subunit C
MLTLEGCLAKILKERKSEVLKNSLSLGELTLWIAPEVLARFLTYLRDDPQLQFKQLTDLCGVDYPHRPDRFEVVYHLLSLKLNLRIRLMVGATEGKPIPSCVYIFSAAGWYEREAFDLYGIVFEGHPDLRRLLTDYGFEGHPLRKDFPLTGFVEPHYDDLQQKVVYGPVNLPQEYRNFDTLSPWAGMTQARPVLPGDEKATVHES